MGSVEGIDAWRCSRPVDLHHCPLCGGPFDHEEHGETPAGEPMNLIGCSTCRFSFIFDPMKEEVTDVCVVRDSGSRHRE